MKYKISILINLSNILLISCIFYVISRHVVHLPSFQTISPYLSLGFLIVSAYLAGSIAKSLGLPSLTGYLAAGILFGPSLLGFISEPDIVSLGLINSLALSFIAITAGGELRFKSIKKNILPILGITCSHSVIIFSGIFVVFWILFTSTSLIPIPDSTTALCFALFLGVLALANSPASTIAIISEYKAKGDFTDIVLSVTMLKDTIVLIGFALVMGFATGLTEGTTFSLPFLMQILGHLALSCCAGLLYGFLMILFFKFIAKEISIFIIIASFIAHEFAHFVGLEHMLMCLIAGITVQNFSRQGNMMIEAIEESHLPIYVVFFSIAGASLNFSFFRTAFLLIMLFVIIRIVLILASTYLGSKLTAGPPTVQKYSWTGFVANAGLALSMLIIIDNTFSGWGPVFKAIVISAIALNQILGPILFKYGIVRTSEVRKT